MQNPGHELYGAPRRISLPPTWLSDFPLSDEEINLMVLSRPEMLPEIRTELMRSLSKAIRENRYSVPERQVAEMMIYRRLASRLN
jgi:hypothetical protein